MTRLVTLLLALAMATPCWAEASGKHLFILSGQSNMERFDPAISFTPAVETALGKENVIVVHDAKGGQPIREWYKQWKAAGAAKANVAANGKLYDRLMAKVKAATKGQSLESVTFIWMQGERDAKDKQSAVYAASLQGLVDQLSRDLNRNDIHVIIGRLSDHGLNEPQWVKVREAQMEFVKSYPSAAWVNTDDLNGPENDVHYTKDGYRLLGERYAEKALGFIQKKTEPQTP